MVARGLIGSKLRRCGLGSARAFGVFSVGCAGNCYWRRRMRFAGRRLLPQGQTAVGGGDGADARKVSPPHAKYRALRREFGDRVDVRRMLTVQTTRPDPYRGLLAFGVADATLCLGRQSRFRPMAFQEQPWGGPSGAASAMQKAKRPVGPSPIFFQSTGRRLFAALECFQRAARRETSRQGSRRRVREEAAGQQRSAGPRRCCRRIRRTRDSCSPR